MHNFYSVGLWCTVMKLIVVSLTSGHFLRGKHLKGRARRRGSLLLPKPTLVFVMCAVRFLLLLWVVLEAGLSGTVGQEGEGDDGTSDWALVWEEEFQGQDLRDQWEFETGCWGHGEVECYTDDQEENARQENSTLLIAALKQAVSDSDGGYNNSGYIVTSARLASKKAWRYGKFEMSARLPLGRYLWPAFWMMPASSLPYGMWPRSGEIDIMEYRGSRPDQVCGTLHFGKNPGSGHRLLGSGDTTFPFDFSSEWHKFALLWNATGMWWSVDDILYHHQDLQGNIFPGFYQQDGEPFVGTPFYIIINLAVGGNFFLTEKPFQMSVPDEWPKSTFEIDWIRVWQKKEVANFQ